MSEYRYASTTTHIFDPKPAKTHCNYSNPD